MKKSTLITTIAMIVVVVVALSTATYAWFSASSVSTAEVAMTTTATSDWMIFKGNTSDVTTAKVYTFTNAASDEIQLTATELQKGLKAPSSAEWTNTISVTGTEATVSAREFLTAKKGAKTLVDGAPTEYDPYVLKVSNASGTTKSLQVTVIINAGPSSTTGTLYAAAATTFDIAYLTTKTGASVQNVTKGYSKCATKEGGYSDQEEVTAATPAVPASTFDTGSSEAFNYANATAMTNSTYTYFKKAPAENLQPTDIAWGLSANDYYLAYTITIADLASTDSVYLSIFPWIDGWVADNSAGGASYKINFAFTSVASAQNSSNDQQP